jgi:hypothetical protein
MEGRPEEAPKKAWELPLFCGDPPAGRPPGFPCAPDLAHSRLLPAMPMILCNRFRCASSGAAGPPGLAADVTSCVPGRNPPMGMRLGILGLVAFFALANPLMSAEACWPGQPEPRGFWHRLSDRLQRLSCGYGKTHHDFGCTGCPAAKIFIFGSCWQFFEEPCFRQPLPPPRLFDRRTHQD